MRVYWVFLLLNVFILSTVALSIFNVLDTLINDPGKVLELMGKSVPKQVSNNSNHNHIHIHIHYLILSHSLFISFLLSQALFYTNYIILQGFGTE